LSIPRPVYRTEQFRHLPVQSFRYPVSSIFGTLLQLRKEGFFWEREEITALSPYLTSHIKRFGDYLIDLDAIPQPLEEKLNLAF